MDSHEERVHNAVRQSQEKEAKQKMREKAKQLSKLQRTQQLNKRNANSNFVVVKSNEEDKADPIIEDKPTETSYSKPKVNCIFSFDLLNLFINTFFYLLNCSLNH